MTQSKEEHANMALFDGPLTIRKAMQCVDAHKYKSLMANGTWKLTLISNNPCPIGCKWVFCAKRDAMGHVVRYIARLVTKGFT